MIRWPIWPSGPSCERDRARADIHDGQELKGSINRPDTEAQDQPSPVIIFGLQRAAGPYRWANRRHPRSHPLGSKDASARPYCGTPEGVGEIVPSVDGSWLARRISTSRRWSVQPCARPVGCGSHDRWPECPPRIRSRSQPTMQWHKWVVLTASLNQRFRGPLVDISGHGRLQQPTSAIPTFSACRHAFFVGSC